MLLGMHGYVLDGRRRWLALLAAGWLLQGLSNGYYLLFLPVLIVPWLVWFVDWRAAPRRGLVVAATWLFASLPFVPILLEYRSVHSSLGLARSFGDLARFSATAASFLHAPPLLAVWPTASVPTQEDYLFPGVTAIAVTLAALLTLLSAVRATPFPERRNLLGRRSPLLFYAVATIALWGCAFGPGAEPAGPGAWLRPYRWLALLPGYDGLRVPARFAMLASLCLSIAAGLAVARLQVIWRRGFGALAALVLAGLVLDGLMQAVPLGAPPPRAIIPGPPDAAVLELPADDAGVNVAAMYRAMEHRRPLLNGYSGHTPPHYTILSLALRRGDTSPLRYLAIGRPLIIVVNDQHDEDGGFRAMVEQVPSIERIGITSAGSVFRLPAQPREVQSPTGTPLPYRGNDVGGGRAVLDLGSTQVVRAVTFNLRRHYPELGERLLIESSEEGQSWQQAWLGWTGGLALAAALEDPLTAPVRIPLADVRGRYLRIYPAPTWLVRELTVGGP